MVEYFYCLPYDDQHFGDFFYKKRLLKRLVKNNYKNYQNNISHL
jgi:hypothetical protein